MTTHDNAKDKMTQKLIKTAALGIYHAPGGKRLLNWFFDWCER